MSSGQLPSTESCILQLAHAEATKTAGGSLARTLYTRPLTVLLHGELGSGKTTFFQGFAEALGVKTHVTSPTFAIEQRYETTGHGELLHLDLFRLNADEAKNILQQSEAHQGIRVVEWADRTQLPFSEPHIAIWLSESGSSRTLDCTFADMALPGREEILEWRTHMELPEHIAQHCDAVADFSTEFAEYFVKQSMFVRTVALHKAAEVHDLLRFMDFRPGAGPAGAVDEEHAVWEEVKKTYAGMQHEAAVAAFLRERGFTDLATIVETHGVRVVPEENGTIEQFLLYYTDKRLIVDARYSLDERFADFAKRYNLGDASLEKSAFWLQQAKDIEHRLFPDGVPF